MVKAIPYLSVSSGKQAIELYSKVFNAKELSRMPYTDDVGKSMGFPDDYDYDNSTMHASIGLGDAIVYLADSGSSKSDMGNVDVLLEIDNKHEIQSYFENAKKEGFTIAWELEKTFWGAWYAKVVDPFGIGWQLNFQEDEM